MHLIAQPLANAWRKPLSAAELGYLALVLFVGGTIYCQLYCAISMPAMNGMRMPLELSMWRSALELLPSLAAFEASKRVLAGRRGLSALIAVCLILAMGALLSASMVLLWHDFFHHSAMPLRLVVADRLLGLTLTGVAIGWAAWLQRGQHAAEPRTPAVADLDSLPPLRAIAWAQAAGNYVELHVDGRTILVRMLLGDLAEALPRGRFIRIHRSLLVNRDWIAHWDRPSRPRTVQLRDGTMLKVGDSYRASLPPTGFVTPSHFAGRTA